MYLLDTNVISELRKAKSGKANKNVIKWAKDVSPSSLFLSIITILELETGVLLAERRDPSQGAVLRSWLNAHVFPVFSERILYLDVAVAQRCAKFHIPNPRSDRNAIIMVPGVVTENCQNFRYNETIMNMIAVLKALSNEKRLKILQWLKEPKKNFTSVHCDIEKDGVCVGLIEENIGLSQSTRSE